MTETEIRAAARDLRALLSAHPKSQVSIAFNDSERDSYVAVTAWIGARFDKPVSAWGNTVEEAVGMVKQKLAERVEP